MPARHACAYDLGTGTVVPAHPEAPGPPDEPESDVPVGTRVLAPIYDPHGYAKHWPATVVEIDTTVPEQLLAPWRADYGDWTGYRRALVRYEQGHGVGNYWRVLQGNVFTCDLTEAA